MQSLWLLLSSALTAATYASMKFLPAGFAFQDIFFIRMCFMFAAAAGAAALAGTAFKTEHGGLHAVRSAAGIAALSLNIIVVQHLPLGTAQTLAYTGPVFVTLWTVGTALLLGRRPGWALALTAAVGFAGVLLMMRPSAEGEILYLGLGLFSGLASAVSGLTLRTLGRRGEPVLRTVMYFALSGTLVGALLFFLFSERSVTELLAQPAMWGVGLCTLGAQLAQTRGWGKGKTLLSATLQFSSIPFALLMGLLFFGERPDATALTGITVILLSEIAAVLVQAKARTNAHRVTKS